MASKKSATGAGSTSGTRSRIPNPRPAITSSNRFGTTGARSGTNGTTGTKTGINATMGFRTGTGGTTGTKTGTSGTTSSKSGISGMAGTKSGTGGARSGTTGTTDTKTGTVGTTGTRTGTSVTIGVRPGTNGTTGVKTGVTGTMGGRSGAAGATGARSWNTGTTGAKTGSSGTTGVRSGTTNIQSGVSGTIGTKSEAKGHGSVPTALTNSGSTFKPGAARDSKKLANSSSTNLRSKNISSVSVEPGAPSLPSTKGMPTGSKEAESITHSNWLTAEIDGQNIPPAESRDSRPSDGGPCAREVDEATRRLSAHMATRGIQTSELDSIQTISCQTQPIVDQTVTETCDLDPETDGRRVDSGNASDVNRPTTNPSNGTGTGTCAPIHDEETVAEPMADVGMRGSTRGSPGDDAWCSADSSIAMAMPTMPRSSHRTFNIVSQLEDDPANDSHDNEPFVPFTPVLEDASASTSTLIAFNRATPSLLRSANRQSRSRPPSSRPMSASGDEAFAQRLLEEEMAALQQQDEEFARQLSDELNTEDSPFTALRSLSRADVQTDGRRNRTDRSRMFLQDLFTLMQDVDSELDDHETAASESTEETQGASAAPPRSPNPLRSLLELSALMERGNRFSNRDVEQGAARDVRSPERRHTLSTSSTDEDWVPSPDPSRLRDVTFGDIMHNPMLLLAVMMQNSSQELAIHQALERNDYESLWNLAERLGEVKHKGITQEEIDTIPTRQFTESDDHEGVECRICLTAYDKGETIRILPCTHEFHAGCIDKWLESNASCPICRKAAKESEP